MHKHNAAAANFTVVDQAESNYAGNGHGQRQASGSPGDLSSGRPDSPPPVTLARPFRSRKNRPCDGCRRAKTRCAIVEVGTPCVECQHTRKKCTFDEKPRERKKPAKKRELSPQLASQLSVSAISPSHASSVEREGDEVTIDSDPVPPKRQRTGREEHSGAVSLEETLGYHMITTVLTDDLLPVGARQAGAQGDEHIRQISTDSAKPQYVIFSKKVEDAKPRQPLNSLQNPVHAALSLLQPPPPPTAVLLQIYIEKSNKAFPILPPPLGNSYAVPILAKVYIAALNHLPVGQCRPYAAEVRDLLVPAATNIHRSSLASISDALLDVSARPAGDAEEDYLVLAKAIAQAQLMGLHIDPSGWGIPSWEKDFRRVLWWALRVHDGWSSFLNSRPSHIQANNHDVGVPDLPSIRTTTLSHLSASAQSSSENEGLAFHLLCRLGVLVSRLQREICTVMARREEREERVARVVEIEQDVERLLGEVREGFKPGNGRDPANIPGIYSFMTTIFGFRCMIRRIAIELSIGLGAPFTPDQDTLSRYAQAVDYFMSLPGEAFDGWWLVHVGHIFSSVMSSLIRLSLATTASNPEAPAPSPSFSRPTFLPVPASLNPIFLLARLRHALQRARDLYKWDLADAALARAENVARVLGNLIEGEDPGSVGGYGHVVRALQGPRPGSAGGGTAGLNGSGIAQTNGGLGGQGMGIGAGGGSWNIDLSALGTGLDWTGFEGFEGMQPVGNGQGWSPDYGFVSS